MKNTQICYKLATSLSFFPIPEIVPPLAFCPLPPFLDNAAKLGSIHWSYYIPTVSQLFTEPSVCAITLWRERVWKTEGLRDTVLRLLTAAWPSGAPVRLPLEGGLFGSVALVVGFPLAHQIFGTVYDWSARCEALVADEIITPTEGAHALVYAAWSFHTEPPTLLDFLILIGARDPTAGVGALERALTRLVHIHSL